MNCAAWRRWPLTRFARQAALINLPRCLRASAVLSTWPCAIVRTFGPKAKARGCDATLWFTPKTTNRLQNQRGERFLSCSGSERYTETLNLDDTIVAIATPPGRGGIGVVRLAGTEARAIALTMLRLKHELEAGRAVFGDLVDAQDNSSHRIDEVVVSYFAKPHSYTTDDIVEISAHGSPVVLAHIVELALAHGARLAEPGEFTMRAFLNGRIDLTQAEAVRDLIESQTLYQAKVAAQQLGGALSQRLQPIKAKLVELIALLEAGIDFAE